MQPSGNFPTKNSAAGSGVAVAEVSGNLLEKFFSVRHATEKLCQSLSPEDQMVQSCPEASPVKWHLAHTSWFFETFVLREFLSGYRPFHPDFGWLFNSYYRSLGEHPEKKLRASFSRPSLDEIHAYRKHVEEGIAQLLAHSDEAEVCSRIELGLHHEQQHQELIATDIKHALWTNPLHPAYAEPLPQQEVAAASPLCWLDYPGGLADIGHAGNGFSFDNEAPRHRVYLQPFQLASRAVTCAEYLAFLQDRGYSKPNLWLSEGWDTLRAEGWDAPLYWHQNKEGEWHIYTLRGIQPLSELATTPVCHISFFEADAYARWAKARLATEAEWEVAASTAPIAGNLLESEALHPRTAQASASNAPAQLFGDVWEWTQSAYTGYPGYRAQPGALGEYNGKFMSSQMVLRGGSCVTPATHIRATYRNFFPPATRWQFSGIRLAQDAAGVR
ncbi:MAG: ergothioneine biosynthesis protein EgtB [Acidobacteriaceae bacterium]